MAWIMDGKYRPWAVFRWFEQRLDSGEQNWKQYLFSLLLFNTLMFVFSFLVLALQPCTPLNPEGLRCWRRAPFFTASSHFMTNTDLQHYSGDQHLSNFSQIFFGIFNLFFSAAIGLCALVAIIRALRGDSSVGNFFVDMWRVLVYMFVPAALIFGLIFITQGSPMTFQTSHDVSDARTGGDGHNRHGRGETADDYRGAGRGLGIYENAGHQRGRVLRHELRAPVRKSHRTVKFLQYLCDDDVPVRSGIYVWPNAEAGSGTPL